LPEDDDQDLSGTHVYLVLMMAHRAVSAHAMASFAAMDLGRSDFLILEVLLHKGPQLVNDIGRRIALTSGSMTTAIDRLEERGLVERVADSKDRRAKRVTLTREGKALITKAFAAHKKRVDRSADALSKPERAKLISLLKKLGRGAEATKPSDDE
jgi:MarR family 2-MHQ and catechol resistance regulon transcriptional repressor